jgi:hypothetical protein
VTPDMRRAKQPGSPPQSRPRGHPYHPALVTVAVVGPGMLALSAACVALLTVSGLLGGRLTHRFGVSVADDVTQAPSHRAARRNTPPDSGYR